MFKPGIGDGDEVAELGQGHGRIVRQGNDAGAAHRAPPDNQMECTRSTVPFPARSCAREHRLTLRRLPPMHPTPLFPLYADLQGRTVLVVGGGAVARRKVEALIESGAVVRVGRAATRIAARAAR
jgi:hypothetical protein